MQRLFFSDPDLDVELGFVTFLPQKCPADPWLVLAVMASVYFLCMSVLFCITSVHAFGSQCSTTEIPLIACSMLYWKELSEFLELGH